MNNICISREMYEDVKELKYESQVRIIMAFITYFYRGNVERYELTELEQYVFNRWVDTTLSNYSNISITDNKYSNMS